METVSSTDTSPQLSICSFEMCHSYIKKPLDSSYKNLSASGYQTHSHRVHETCPSGKVRIKANFSLKSKKPAKLDVIKEEKVENSTNYVLHMHGLNQVQYKT